jgi:hypothetical protein
MGAERGVGKGLPDPSGFGTGAGALRRRSWVPAFLLTHPRPVQGAQGAAPAPAWVPLQPGGQTLDGDRCPGCHSAHLRRAPDRTALQRRRGQDAGDAQLLCGNPGPASRLSRCGAAQSLRSPASRPIPAPGLRSPAPCALRGAGPSQARAAEAGRAGCPFGEDYISWRKDTLNQNRRDVMLRWPMGKWQGGRTRPPEHRTPTSQTPGRPGHLLLPDWDGWTGALVLAFCPGCPRCPGLPGMRPDL